MAHIFVCKIKTCQTLYTYTAEWEEGYVRFYISDDREISQGRGCKTGAEKFRFCSLVHLLFHPQIKLLKWNEKSLNLWRLIVEWGGVGD